MAGGAIGAALGLGTTRLLSSLRFGIHPIDPLAFAAVTELLIFVALLASYVPARPATPVNPAIAIRAG